MKYVIDGNGDIYLFPAKWSHDDFWAELNNSPCPCTGPQSAGIVNIVSGRVKVQSGSMTLDIEESPERTETDKTIITDYLSYL